MITNFKTKDKSHCKCDIFGRMNKVQFNFPNFKNYYSDQKIIQKFHPTSNYHKQSISKVKRIFEIDLNYQRKLKEHYFTTTSSTPNSNRISNNINQYIKQKDKPKKVIQITKINQLLNQFKTKYDALTKKININSRPQISNHNVSNKVNYGVCLLRTPIKSKVKKDARFSIQPKSFEKQSCQVINSPNLQNSKSAQNLPNLNFPLKTSNALNTPDTIFTFSTSNSKTTLNQRTQYLQDNLNISIEMIIQNNTNIKTFPSLQTVLSQNDISSMVDQNQSNQGSIVIGTFKQLPSSLFQKQSLVLNKVSNNCKFPSRLLSQRKIMNKHEIVNE